MVRVGSEGSRSRSESSTPSTAATRAAERAAAAAGAAAEAASAAAEAAGAQPQSDAVTTSATPWPLPTNNLGLRWWFARDYPGLSDGVYALPALEARQVDPNRVAAEGLLIGFKGPEAALRRAYVTGVESSHIFWR